MSGLNQNGYAESKRMILGVGDLYIDDVFVGNLKESVTLKITRDYAYQRAGNNVADQKAEVISEEAIIEASVCDLKLSQLRRALGITEAVDITSDMTIRKREIVQLVGTTGVAPAQTPVSGTTKVSSLDRKTSYVSGTDFKYSSSNLERVSGGAITDGQQVIVEYDFIDSGAQGLPMGGETKAPPTFQLDFVIRDDTGKAWMITFWKAMTNTDFEMAFNERESGDFTVHNVSFKALVDTTKPEGKNLLQIMQEDAAT